MISRPADAARLLTLKVMIQYKGNSKTSESSLKDTCTRINVIVSVSCLF